MWVASLSFASFGAIFVGVSVLAPTLRARFDVSVAEVGLMFGSLEAGMVIALIGWGEVVDRLGEKVTLVIGLIGTGVAVAGASVAPTFPVLLGSLAMTGVFGAAISVASPRIVLGQFPLSERGLALGIRQTAIPVSGVVVAIVLAPIAAHGGTRLGLIVLCLPLFIVAVLAALRLDANHHPSLRRRSDEKVRHPARDSRVWRVAMAGGFMLPGQSVLIGFGTLFLVDQRGVAVQHAAGVLAGTLAMGAILLVVVGRWSDHRGEHVRILRQLCLLHASGFGTLFALNAATLWALVPVIMITGAISLSWVPLPVAALGGLVPRGRQGAAIGIQQMVLAIAAMLSPILFGWSVEAFSWSAGFGAIALLALLAVAPLAGLRDPTPLRDCDPTPGSNANPH